MDRNKWLALIALEDGALPDLEVFAEALAQEGDSERVLDLAEKENLLTFRQGESHVLLSLIPQPIPAEQLEGPCATAWYWPDAAAAMRDHTHHIMVVVLDEGRDPIEKSMRLTRTVSAITNTCPVQGIFWGPGRLVHEPGPFLEQAGQMTRENLPLYLWIDFRIESLPDGSLRLFTTGLESLGVDELEAGGYRGDRQQLLQWVYNVAHYALEPKKPLKDGDTIGLTDTMKWTLRRGPSAVDPSQFVLHLEH